MQLVERSCSRIILVQVQWKLLVGQSRPLCEIPILPTCGVSTPVGVGRAAPLFSGASQIVGTIPFLSTVKAG